MQPGGHRFDPGQLHQNVASLWVDLAREAILILVIVVYALIVSLIGAAIGLVVAVVVYRGRRRFLRAAVFGGLAWLGMMALASSGSVSSSGRPWISFINSTSKSYPISCILGSVAGGLIAGIGRRPKTNDQRPA